ncbi:DNA sulfur modification protein DndB [Bacillus sp. OV166]|uniref:DNA sulfur modification protein DndB n=1 Tax=Bacillus sp. OV166 TaxID=1882763 RepID=UPI000A2AC700|nr:DNA sulfur modification protein DndB [Bacillus sp. OV166]SMQ60979.1 DNA sulfur modification protein DndB [Bacillus sp. OV166]
MDDFRLIGSIQVIDQDEKKALMTTQIKVRDILTRYRIDPGINRDLSYNRIPKIIQYVDSFETDIGIFLPSIVCTFPEDPTRYYDREKMELVVPAGCKLVVIDGQHRIKSLEQYTTSKGLSEEKKERILDSDMTLQLYFGLTILDEQTLFADMNSNSKRVSMSLIANYDTRDLMNVLVKELYNISKPLQSIRVEFNKSRLVRPTSTHFTTSVRLKKFISLLLFGKKEPSSKDEHLIKEYYDELLSFLERFFRVLIEVMPPEPGNVLKYMLGHNPLQNAIALYCHKRIMTENTQRFSWIVNWEEVVGELRDVNWTTKNPEWRPYMLVSRANTPYEFHLFIENVERELLRILEKEEGALKLLND